MQKNYEGFVITGLGKGKEFGFRTINIILINNEINIENGVYATLVTIQNQTYKGMLYVGTRPTLNLKDFSIEIHLFDFNEDIYHQQISFRILRKIRDEIKFKDIATLVEQLHQDKEMVNNYLSSMLLNSSKL